MAISRYDYEELRAAAENGTQEDINRLGEWFSLYGGVYWNGEVYDADGFYIKPVLEPIDDDECQYKTVGYKKS